jgi:hypothetical protein
MEPEVDDVEVAEAADGDSEVSEVAAAEAPTASDAPTTAVSGAQTPETVTTWLGASPFWTPEAEAARATQNLQEIAQRAVDRVLAEQKEVARYDVYDQRVTITLEADILAQYRVAWMARNDQREDKILFSEYLSQRIKACSMHISTRPVFIRDHIRQQIEDLFGQAVVSDQDLLNQLDRTIKPIVQTSVGGPLVMPPIDPDLLELVTAWEPDKTPADALGEFMLLAAQEKAGLR